MMKKIYIFLLAFMPLWVMAQDRIMVIADPHVLPQSVIAQDANFDTYMQSQRKMIDLSEPIWNALIDTALAYRPSLVLIPGDLTRDGETESHQMVANSLNQLQEAGIRTLVIPGNHDLPGDNWESLYAGTYENAIKDLESHSFAVEPIPGVTVIGIDGSDGNAGIGKLSETTLAFILAQADSAVAKGNTIIAMSHWQILEHFDQQGTLESSCRFKNADALRDSLMCHGVHLVLTGHFHINGITTYRDTTGLAMDSLVEITTGSPITYPCPYRWLTLNPSLGKIAVETDFLTAVDTIADLEDYSREWMREHATNMIPALALRAWNKIDNNWDKVEAKLALVGLDYLASYLKSRLPATDAERIEITQRYLGTAAVDMYLFHSEANEFERPEMGREIADSVYAGMDGMMNECFGVFVEVAPIFKTMAKSMAEEPVESLVADITQRGKTNEDLTDDLHPVLRIREPWAEGIEKTETKEASYRKVIRDGHVFIEHPDGSRYTILGEKQ